MGRLSIEQKTSGSPETQTAGAGGIEPPSRAVGGGVIGPDEGDPEAGLFRALDGASRVAESNPRQASAFLQDLDKVMARHGLSPDKGGAVRRQRVDRFISRVRAEKLTDAVGLGEYFRTMPSLRGVIRAIRGR